MSTADAACLDEGDDVRTRRGSAALALSMGLVAGLAGCGGTAAPAPMDSGGDDGAVVREMQREQMQDRMDDLARQRAEERQRYQDEYNSQIP
jgi:hypothetical protein